MTPCLAPAEPAERLCVARLSGAEFLEVEICVALAGIIGERLAYRDCSRACRRDLRRVGSATLKAYHEASHAVVSAARGMHVQEVSIVPDATVRVGDVIRGGFSRSTYAPPPAGYRVAESADTTTLETDMQRVISLLRLMGLRLNYLRTLREQTDQLLVKNWPAVKALAAELYLHGVLGLDDIQRILAEFNPAG